MAQHIRRFGSIVARLLTLALTIVASLGLVAAGPRPVASAESSPVGVQAAEGSAQVSALAIQQTVEVIGEEASVVAEALAYRDGPGVDTAVIAYLPYGTSGIVVDGPVAADGYTWYAFSTEGYATPGWVAGEFLAPAGGGAAVGTAAVVTADEVRLRADPTLDGAILAVLPLGTQLTILDGPEESDGYTWYKVSVPALAGEGWMAGEFLALASGTEGFAPGDAVIVSGDELSLREAPSLGGPVLALLAIGTEVTITDGPIMADGYTWYQIAIEGTDGDGWIAGEFLAYP